MHTGTHHADAIKEGSYTYKQMLWCYSTPPTKWKYTADRRHSGFWVIAWETEQQSGRKQHRYMWERDTKNKLEFDKL